MKEDLDSILGSEHQFYQLLRFVVRVQRHLEPATNCTVVENA